MTNRDEPDADLVDRANQGDATAFDGLYRRHRDWVVSVAMRLGADRDDALDILQETFAHLFDQFPGFTLTSQLRTYLYPAVKHRWLDIQRRRRTRVRLIRLISPPPPGPPPDSDRVDGGRLLATLTAEQREVALLRFVDDLPLGEIAAALDVPVGTVKSRLHAAIAAMRAAAAVSEKKVR